MLSPQLLITLRGWWRVGRAGALALPGRETGGSTSPTIRLSYRAKRPISSAAFPGRLHRFPASLFRVPYHYRVGTCRALSSAEFNTNVRIGFLRFTPLCDRCKACIFETQAVLPSLNFQSEERSSFGSPSDSRALRTESIIRQRPRYTAKVFVKIIKQNFILRRSNAHQVVYHPMDESIRPRFPSEKGF
jgi:hypothetical protein